jgi:hypothetical protein
VRLAQTPQYDPTCKEARVPSPDWQNLAQEVLKPAEKPDELVTARTSDITKIGAAVTTLVGVLVSSLFGANFAFNGEKVESLIAAALIVSTCVLGVLLVYASDFRTRGRVATARFDAIARLGEQHIESDVLALQSRLDASESAQHVLQSELVDKLAATLASLLQPASGPDLPTSP